VRYLFLLLIPLIGSCSDEYTPVPTSNGPAWEISGVVLDGGTGRPIAGQSVDLVRLERSCRWCKVRAVDFVTTATDSAGRFVFNSRVVGVYDLYAVSSKNSFCADSKALGYLSSQKMSVRLEIPQKSCIARM